MTIKDLRSLLTLRGYDCSQCLEKSELVAVAQRMDATNYDDEAHKILRQLNLEGQQSGLMTKSRHSNVDAIWKDPGVGGGGTVYVGNYMAASDRRTLDERGIVAVVNCQDENSQNYFENDDDDDTPTIQYHRFVVSRLAVSWDLYPHPFHHGFEQAFDFIQSNIDQGKSVLIHCLAGAHRAGTVGTAWLMYKTGTGVSDALHMAKSCRPIIAPFGTLMELLHRLESEFQSKNHQQGREIE